MAFELHRNKHMTFTLDSQEYNVQVQSYTFDPGIDDGDVLWSYGPEGSNRNIQETDDNPTLAVTFYADFKTTGVSRYLWEHKGEDVAFELVHLLGTAGQEFTITGTLRLRPGPVGGDVRENDMTEVTFQVIEYELGGA